MQLLIYNWKNWIWSARRKSPRTKYLTKEAKGDIIHRVKQEKSQRSSLVVFFLNRKAVGVNYREGPPVPIPNTEVKLVCADDSVWVTACENR